MHSGEPVAEQDERGRVAQREGQGEEWALRQAGEGADGDGEIGEEVGGEREERADELEAGVVGVRCGTRGRGDGADAGEGGDQGWGVGGLRVGWSLGFGVVVAGGEIRETGWWGVRRGCELRACGLEFHVVEALGPDRFRQVGLEVGGVDDGQVHRADREPFVGFGNVTIV